MQVFQSIRDEEVVRCIEAATSRVVYVAPGVSTPIATALVACLTGGKVRQIAIVLDADEDACRLGYCDVAALEVLSAAAKRRGVAIRTEAGLRLGLLMSDADVLIWTPTPLMFEAPRGAAETNGLHLTAQTLVELPLALGVDPESAPDDAEIGVAILAPEEIARVSAAIKAAPPAPFDVTRLARVFSTKFQFIETELRGAALTKREMRLDSLIANADAPEGLQGLLQTTVQPFNTEADKAVDVPVMVAGEQAFNRAGQPLTKPATQAEIHGYWAELTGKYVINLPGFGKIIRQTDKASFEAGRADFETVLKAWVVGFQELVKGDHDTRVNRVVDLIEQRMTRATAQQRMKRADIAALVRKGLDNLRVIAPSVKVVFKNITVESTRDKEFLDVLRKAVPEKDLKDWFHFFSAAPMVQPAGNP